MTKCNSCGISLQIGNENLDGFTNNIENKICNRCFKIKHYNDYQVADLKNDEIIPLLKTIDKDNNLIVLIVDILSLTSNIESILKIFNKNVLLVINKFDVLPKSIKEETILDSITDNFIDKIIVSSNNGYNIDKLYTKLTEYNTNIYFVGYTNSGKSTLINRLILEYNNDLTKLTTSNMPSTTLNLNEIKIDKNLTITDTPGIIDEGSITNYINKEELKKLVIKKRIKPLTFQLYNNDILEIGFGIYIGAKSKVNLTVYIPNSINPFKSKNNNLRELKSITLKPFNSDYVIPGLGFINIKKEAKINIYSVYNIDIIERKSIFK